MVHRNNNSASALHVASGNGQLSGSAPEALKKALGAGEYFTLSFAAIVGIGWIVMLGNWLRLGGPMGSVLAFAAAGVVMMLVGLCYGEICTMIPASGGEIAYAYEVFGLRASFVSGWFLALIWISATSFEAICTGWVTSILFPSVQGPVLYTVRGTPVMAGPLILSLVGTLFLTFLNYRGMEGSARFQDVFTWTKIAISVMLAAAAILWGRVDNLRPLFATGTDHRVTWLGILQVLVTAPFWLAGFNTVAQVMEEKKPESSYGAVAFALLASIAAASLFYGAIILSCSMAMPWRDILVEDLPAAAAFRAALHSDLGAKLVLASGLLGLLATWNSVFVAGSRTLFALGRARMIHPTFAYVDPRFGSPTISIIWVGALSAAGVMIGRGALLPIVNMDSSCFMLMYIMVCVAMIRMRSTAPALRRPFRVPGGVWTAGIATAASVSMAIESFYLPYAAGRTHIPLEWIVFIVWTVMGVGFWALAANVRGEVSEGERRELILGQRRLSS
ncbi:MAG: APC family permease [Terriglobales bacterium]|jgi:amino acid transporter